MTNIADRHRAAFEALTSGQYRNFALFSCAACPAKAGVDGAPAVAIVTVNQDGEQYLIEPLFVSVTSAMTIIDHNGRHPEA